MTQEDKELLFKELCSRSPYKVKVLNTTYANHDVQTVLGVVGDEIIMVEQYNSVRGDDLEYSSAKHYTGYIESVKPYLRPMSDMTEREKEEFDNLYNWSCPNSKFLRTKIIDISELIDWLNAHYFDYRGLIPKGLALEAPEEMYNLKDK